jgi:radical SAM superfamily enzyme YgiQ (UPF0313 family)
MRQAGCRRILYGLESGVQELLDNVKKDFTLDSARKTIAYTKKEGIQTAGLFMIGLLGETSQMTRGTINFAKEIDLDFTKFSITVPYPGSALYEDLTKSGKLARHDWENFVTFNDNPKELVSVSDKISPEELIYLQQKGHRDFYMRPKVILNQLFKVRSLGIKDLFYGLLGLFYRHRNH